jgi:hypothetical protein
LLFRLGYPDSSTEVNYFVIILAKEVKWKQELYMATEKACRAFWTCIQ